jgi:hypothetical protein
LEGQSRRSLAEAFHMALRDSLVVERSEAERVLEELDVRREVADDFIAACGGWRRLNDDSWVQWSGPVGNKAETVLRLVGEPLTVEEINGRVGEGHALSSLKNALAADARFIRIDKFNRFGLAEWGLEEYSGIAQEIRERIERQGGSAEVDALVAEFVSKFGVSETSVRMYAASPAFVLDDGWVRLRRDDEPFETASRISSVKGLFIDAEGDVIVHLEVDRDVLRGSGRQFYAGAATALGVSPGERREFAGGNGTRVVVSWPTTSVMGPALGSVRSFALELGLVEGERLRVILEADDGTCRGERVEADTLRGLTGLECAEGDDLATVAAAIGVATSEVRIALRDRGDYEVLALLPELDVSEDLVDAITEFGELLG